MSSRRSWSWVERHPLQQLHRLNPQVPHQIVTPVGGRIKSARIPHISGWVINCISGARKPADLRCLFWIDLGPRSAPNTLPPGWLARVHWLRLFTGLSSGDPQQLSRKPQGGKPGRRRSGRVTRSLCCVAGRAVDPFWFGCLRGLGGYLRPSVACRRRRSTGGCTRWSGVGCGTAATSRTAASR